jgi:hypothetical protein
MARLFGNICPDAGSYERESEPFSSRSLESYPISRDGELETIVPTLWITHYNSCLHYFMEHGQHTPVVQSLTALISIRLPCQRLSRVDNISPGPCATTPPLVPLRLYIRWLIVTAQDSPSILLALFGDAWDPGVSGISKEERLNYLLMAKSGGRVSTKAAYDIEPTSKPPFYSCYATPLSRRSKRPRCSGVNGWPWKIGWLASEVRGRASRQESSS